MYQEVLLGKNMPGPSDAGFWGLPHSNLGPSKCDNQPRLV